MVPTVPWSLALLGSGPALEGSSWTGKGEGSPPSLYLCSQTQGVVLLETRFQTKRLPAERSVAWGCGGQGDALADSQGGSVWEPLGEFDVDD